MKAFHIAVVVFTVARLVSAVPWLSYLSLRTWRVRDSQAMRKRRARTMIVMSVWIMWYLSSQSFRLISAIMPSFRNSAAERTANHSLILTMVPYFWVRLQRSWLLFHDLKISRATAKQEWIALLTDAYESGSDVNFDNRAQLAAVDSDNINIHHNNDSTAIKLAAALDKAIANAAEEEHSEPSWFLVHWQTYGNPRWLFKRALFAGFIHSGVLFAISLLMFMDETYYMIAWILTLISITMLIIIPVILGFQTPVIQDIILLRKELRLGSYLGTVFSGLMILLMTISYSISGGMPHTPLVMLSTIIFDVFLLSDAYLTLQWIPSELRRKGMLEDLSNSPLFGWRSSISLGQTNLDSPRSQQSLKMKIGDVSRDPSALKQATFELLNDNDGIQLLMTHLMREVSVECLLSVIEFIQFKQWLCGKHCSELDEAGVSASELARRIEEIVSEQVSPNATQSMISMDDTHNNQESLNNEDINVLKIRDYELTPTQLLECPSRLRRIDFGQWTLPKCVRLSGALRKLTVVERRHPSKHGVIRTVMSLRDKYISPDSSLQINVSFLTTQALIKKFNSLNVECASADRTERNLRRLADFSPEVEDAALSVPNAGDFALATPAAFDYDEQWKHEVSHVWDHCIDEMMVLIQASVQRLILSVDYVRWRESSGLNGPQSRSK